MAKWIDVVGAVIFHHGKILCAQRGAAGTLPNMWEFPGGKVEVGESPREALIREVEEELGCRVAVGDKVADTMHEYEFGTVRLTTFACQLLEGTPQLTEHAAVRWLSPDELVQLDGHPPTSKLSSSCTPVALYRRALRCLESFVPLGQ